MLVLGVVVGEGGGVVDETVVELLVVAMIVVLVEDEAVDGLEDAELDEVLDDEAVAGRLVVVEGAGLLDDGALVPASVVVGRLVVSSSSSEDEVFEVDELGVLDPPRQFGTADS